MTVTSETHTGVGAPVKDMGEKVQWRTSPRELHEDMAQIDAGAWRDDADRH